MNSGRFLRLISIFALTGFLLNLSGAAVRAQEPTPQSDGPADSATAVDLGFLSQREGPVKVVIELLDEPAVRTYAAAGGGVSLNAVSQTRAQMSRIQSAQNGFLSAVERSGVQVQEIYRTQRVLNAVALELDSVDVRKLADLPGVKAVYPLVTKELDNSSSVSLVGALEAWDAAGGVYDGEGVSIGIVDTGIDYTHLDFGGPGTAAAFSANDPTKIENGSFPTAKVVGGYDFAGNYYDANGVYGYTTPIPDADPLDCNGHGTHTAGTAAGLGVLNAGGNPAPTDYAGYAALDDAAYRALFRIGPGVAPRADLYALKVFGCGGGTDLTDEAIEWAVDPNKDGDLSDHLDVLNMSLGSSFGTENDTSTIAANNAALAGVIVVASAGNSGDVYFSGGSPGVAQRAISVGGSQDGSLVGDGFAVTQTPKESLIAGNTVFGGLNSFAYNWQAANAAVEGQLKYVAAGSNACQAFAAGAFSGKIALLDWTTLPDGTSECSSTARVANAYRAGAIGVVFAYDRSPMNYTITGITNIPATITRKATGDLLKAALALPENAATPLTVRLSRQYNGAELEPFDFGLTDLQYANSSRGPRRLDGGLKPDLTAPGITIFSAAARSGDQGAVMSGTSMAAPHVAGAMALLRQKYPTWSVEELKALVMNASIHDVLFDTGSGTLPGAPDRVGSGRLDIGGALDAGLIAYVDDASGMVSVSYGFQEVVETSSGADLVTDKNIRIVNKSATTLSATLSFLSRYPSNPGVSYQLFSGGSPLSNPVNLAAGAALTITLRQSLDASQLQRPREPAQASTVSLLGVTYPREYLSTSGGYILIEPFAGTPLRLPVYAVHRPAGQRSAPDTVSMGVADEGLLNIPISGPVVATVDDTPLVQALELVHENPNDTWSTGINNNADLMAVGAAADYNRTPAPDGMADVSVYVGIATYGAWSTPLEVEFQAYFDVDGDLIPDWVALNSGPNVFTGVNADLFVTTVCPYPLPSAANIPDACTVGGTLNGDRLPNGDKLNSNPYNSNVMVLKIPANRLELSAANTAFNFYVDTYNRNNAGLMDTTPWMHYDMLNPAFDTLEPTYDLPIWPDNSDLSLPYDKSALFTQGGSMGLLLLHHHNSGEQAEIVRVNPSYAALIWDKANPPVVIPGRKVTIPLRVVNETESGCNFDLSAAQSGTEWPVTFPMPKVFVPTHGSFVVNATVSLPADTPFGTVKEITLTAACGQPSPVEATNRLILTAAYPLWFPVMHK